MRKYLLIAFLCLFTRMWAYDVEIRGIYYNINTTNKTAKVTSGDNKYQGNITIPTSITYKKTKLNVTGIAVSAFRNCTNLTNITIPNSVTTIESSAFRNCISAGLLPNLPISYKYFSVWLI